MTTIQNVDLSKMTYVDGDFIKVSDYSDYIEDDVVTDAYVKNIANSAYVQGIIDVPYLRSTMTSQFFFYSDAISNDLYTTTSGSVGIGRQPTNSSKYKLDVDGSINSAKFGSDGVVELGDNGQIIRFVEKPKMPKSSQKFFDINITHT